MNGTCTGFAEQSARTYRLRSTLKQFLLVIALAILPFASLEAQVSGLSFSSSSGSYSEISGGTVMFSGTQDDGISSSVPIGFTYQFNGSGYTTCYIGANGWLSFGASASNYSPIDGGGGNGVIAAMGGDLQGNTDGEMRYQTLGSAPNRIFVAQWKNWNSYYYGNYANVYNFQIRLYEADGKAQIVYGPFTLASDFWGSYEIGLRGSVTSDFNNREVYNGSNTWTSSVAGQYNWDYCDLTGSDYTEVKPSNGLTYTWQAPPDDAGIAGFSAPAAPFTAGSKTITAILKNYGTNTLTSIGITWTVNGVAQTAVNWTGSLTPGQTTNVNLGSVTFSSGVNYTIAATSGAPNGQTDGNPGNNTFTKVMRTGMSGTYTIGPSGADFVNFTAAVTAVNAAGVVGAVTFNVQSSTYTEQVNIGAIPGASATNTITFQSLSGNPANVTVNAPNNYSYDVPTVTLDGSNWVTFKNMTISAPYYYGRCITLTGGASNNTISGNIIQPPANYYCVGVMIAGTAPVNNNSILNNTINNSYVSVSAFYSPYNGSTQYGVANNTTIQGNTITSDSYGYYGIYCYPYYGSMNNLLIKSNTIAMSNTSGYYGIYAYGYNPNLANYSGLVNLEISSNTVTTTYTSGYGIYAYYVGANTKVNSNSTTAFSYGTYVYGYSSARPSGCEVKNNTNTNTTNYALYVWYLDAPTVSGNTSTTSLTGTSYYGLYTGSFTGAYSIVKNKTSGGVGGYALYMSSHVGSGVVANNFLQMGSAASTATKYGTYMTSCTGMNYYHNSLNVVGTSGSSYGLYITGGSGNNIRNNNIVQAQANTSAYALYYSATSVVNSSDNNNIYAASTAYFGYAGAAQTSMAAWRSAYNFDLNSVNVDPLYTSMTNLHTTVSALNGIGISTAVTDDIDNQLRSAAPDAGADEFTPAGLDATIRWVAPARPSAAGNNSIIVKIVNLRATPISSALIQYTDGTTTVTEAFSFSPAIQAEGSQNATFLTQYNFQTLTTFSATILNVNGGSDDVATNNTTGPITLRPALSGTYSVCSGNTFPTIQSALTAIDQGGVSGPVTFNICSGAYTTQVLVPVAAGASATNTITIQSATGNAADVSFTPATITSPNMYTFRFTENAAFYILNNLTINASTVVSTNYLVEYRAGNNNIKVQNCILNAGTSYTGYYPFYCNGAYVDNMTVQNCQINGGFNAILFAGVAGGYVTNINILNNTVTDFYQAGIFFNYARNARAVGNTVSRPTRPSYTTFLGILSQYSTGVTIEKNRVHTPNYAGGPASDAYAIRLYGLGVTNAPGEEVVVKNNIVYNLNTTGYAYGITNYYYAQGVWIYNNTVSLNDVSSSSTGYSYGIYHYNTSPESNVAYKNNILSITRGGAGPKLGVYYYNSTGSYPIMDYNLYDVNSAGGNNYIGQSNNGTMQLNLAGWQTTGMDARGVSGDPLFVNNASNDLRILYTSPGAYTGVAIPVVTDDFTGGLRSALYPSMGAYNPPATLRITGSPDFGKVGNTTTRQIVIGNTSAQSAITASFSFTGATTSYRLYYAGTTNPVPTNFTLPANGTLAIDIAFGMQGISGGGSQPATLTFTHNGANTPTSVNVTGYYASLTAVDGALNLLTPGAKFDVGGVLIGGSPKTKGFTAAPDVANLDVPMSFTGYTLTGPDAAFFKVSTLPASINNAIQISITLDPLGASPGTKTAVLTLLHSGYNGPATAITLEGKVGKPLLGAPSVVDLPYVAVGQTYSSTYENYALIPLTRAGLVDVNIFQNPTLTGSGIGQMEVISNAGKYYLKGAYAGGGALVIAGDGQVSNSANWISASVSNPAKVTDVQPLFVVVRMKQQPANNAAPAGAYDAKILFSNGTGAGMSSADNYVETTIVGQIISDPTKLPFFPLQLDFGRVAVNTTSLAKTFTLRNQSGVAGTVTLTINGVDNQSYHFGNGVRVKTVSLPSDNSPLAVQVYFAPTLDGSKIAAISMSGVVNGTAPLSGTGLAPNAGDLVLLYNGQDINGGTLNFGNVAVGQVGTRTITVVNNNVAPVSISSIGRSGQNATQFSVGDMSPSTTVAGNGGTATFAVNFVPTSTSAPSKSGVITVYNSTGTAKQFTVQGTAVTSGGGTVSVTLTPTTYNYGNASGTQVFTLTNTGTSAVTVSGAGILGSTNFAVINAPSFPLTVAAGGTQTFTVQFSATGTNGQRSGTLLVIVNGVSPYPSSQLSGRVGAGTVEGGNGTGSGKLSGEGTIGELLSLTSCYPNPAVEKSTIGYRLAGTSDVVVRLYSSVGKEVGMFNVGTKQSGEHRFEFVSNGFASGTYYYTIEASGSQVSGEIVIVK